MLTQEITLILSLQLNNNKITMEFKILGPKHTEEGYRLQPRNITEEF